MVELDNYKARFIEGEQREFIIQCMGSLGLDNQSLANLLKISVRTLSDWKREKFLIPISVVNLLSDKSGVVKPNNLEILDKYWYVSKGAKLGGVAAYKKYGKIGGDSQNRLKKWKEWWENNGRFEDNPIFRRREFLNPVESCELAEFCGIMIGDGGLSRMQATIYLNSETDFEYSEYVSKLIWRIFGVNPKIFFHKKVLLLGIRVYSINFVNFCKEKELLIGDKIKQGLDIPKWIMLNSDFKIACMRGLMDTDGCVVIHKYRVNNKLYRYKKLEFCSASPALIKSVIQILREFDFAPRLSHNGRNVLVDSQKEVARYLKIIGSNNPKHWERYKS